MNNKSHCKTLTAVLLVLVLIMTACEMPGSIAQSAPSGDDSGQEEPAPEQPVEAPPEEEAPVEEPAAPAATQAPAESTGDVTPQGSTVNIVIVLLVILLIIVVIILIVVAFGRGGQSQPQRPPADAYTTPPTPVDDSESNDSQSP